MTKLYLNLLPGYHLHLNLFRALNNLAYRTVVIVNN